MAPPSVQATSAGTISVAICPGAVRAATIASAASRPISDAADEVRSHFGIGLRDRFDIGSKRRVVAQMIRGMLADNVDDRHLRPARIVQVRDAVGKTGAEMQQRAGRLFGHACVAVRSSRHHPFEQTEHATHFRHAVKGGDDMHFGSARVREAGVHACQPLACEPDFLRRSYYGASAPNRSATHTGLAVKPKLHEDIGKPPRRGSRNVCRGFPDGPQAQSRPGPCWPDWTKLQRDHRERQRRSRPSRILLSPL